MLLLYAIVHNEIEQWVRDFRPIIGVFVYISGGEPGKNTTGLAWLTLITGGREASTYVGTYILTYITINTV